MDFFERVDLAGGRDFKWAAIELGITLSAASHAMRRLEKPSWGSRPSQGVTVTSPIPVFVVLPFHLVKRAVGWKRMKTINLSYGPVGYPAALLTHRSFLAGSLP
jgi:hypothetical protein